VKLVLVYPLCDAGLILFCCSDPFSGVWELLSFSHSIWLLCGSYLIGCFFWSVAEAVFFLWFCLVTCSELNSLSRASPLPPSVLPACEQVTGHVDPAVLAPVRAWVLRPPPVSSLLDSICFGVQVLAPDSVTPLRSVFAQLGQVFLLRGRLIAML
jgi:hypothetical protein